MKKILTFVILLIAQTVNAGDCLFQNDVADCRVKAEKGLALSQHHFANMYLTGSGVTQNYELALKWFRKASEQGYSHSTYNLGLMYLRGNGVSKDTNQGIKLLQKASDQESADAQYLLGAMYYHGENVSKDFKKSIKLLQKAANQGRSKAQYFLGVMYLRGEGVIQDAITAYMYFNIVVINTGDKGVANELEIVAKNMTPQQINEAKEKAEKWIKAYRLRDS